MKRVKLSTEIGILVLNKTKNGSNQTNMYIYRYIRPIFAENLLSLEAKTCEMKLFSFKFLRGMQQRRDSGQMG